MLLNPMWEPKWQRAKIKSQNIFVWVKVGPPTLKVIDKEFILRNGALCVHEIPKQECISYVTNILNPYSSKNSNLYCTATKNDIELLGEFEIDVPLITLEQYEEQIKHAV